MIRKNLKEKKDANEIFQEFQFNIGEKSGNEKTRTIAVASPFDKKNDETKIIDARKFKKQTIEETVIADVQIPYATDKTDNDEDITSEEIFVEELKEVVDLDAKTQVADLNSLLPQVQQEVVESESEFEKQLTPTGALEATSIKIKQIVQKLPKKKRMKTITAIAFFVIFWVLLTDEKPSDVMKIVYPEIRFPVTEEYIDEIKAKEFYRLGLKEYKKNNYMGKYKAALYFKKSAQFKFSKNPALAKLILSYAEIFRNSKQKARAKTVIFRLIQIHSNKLMTDVNVATGAAIFYAHNEKYETAINIIENYLRVMSTTEKGPKMTMKLLSYYMYCRLKLGRLEEARKTLKKLLKIKGGSIEKYLFCAEFFRLNEEHEKAEKLLKEAGTIHKFSAELILRYTWYKFRKQDRKQIEHNLKTLQALLVEKSPIFYSKYLEYRGMLNILDRKNTLAAKYFNKSLDIKESDSLRSRLSALKLGGTSLVQHIILESKIIDLMERSKILFLNGKYEEALKYAIEAADVHTQYIPSHLWLAEIQIDRGFYSNAQDNIGRLLMSHSTNKSLNSKYVEILLASNQVENAYKHITKVTQIKEISESSEFASLLGRVYLKKDLLLVGIRYLKQSVIKNPMSDKDYFRLAKIYFIHRQNTAAKRMLNKAITLVPSNIDYRIFYSKIIYDWDGAEVAIGYLRDELKVFKDNVKIKGQIAIFYYRSGQTRMYEELKKDIEKDYIPDATLYKFLLEATGVDGDIDKLVGYAEKIAIIEPANLHNKIILAENLIILKKYSRAKEVINDVLSRMPSYYKANYFMANLYYEQGDYEQAITFGASESVHYPNSEFGFAVQGKAFFQLSKKTKVKIKKGRQIRYAIKNFEKALSLNPKSREPMMNLAEVKFRQRYYTISREYYNRIWEQDKTDPEVNKRLGYVYKAIGQRQIALEFFQNYLNLLPQASDRPKIEALINDLK